MQELEQKIYAAVNRAEAFGGLGSTATGNAIINVMKPYFKSGSAQEKSYITSRIEQLKKEPGVGFPLNYLALLNA